MKHFLEDIPPLDLLVKKMKGVTTDSFREVNGHIHTPYSFSAFPDMETIFRMAKEEKIAVLGINDFYVTDGYASFHKGCVQNNIFPLFNIEFIGLLKEEQQNGIRINDPNNPGRIYFSGKGLDYPFHTGLKQRIALWKLIRESQGQMKAMIGKLNELIVRQEPELTLSYNKIRKDYARELVRERHLAKAVRMAAVNKFTDPEKQLSFLEALYGGKKAKADINNQAAVENEIRSNLLKSGGAAFVEENEKSFLELNKIIEIILKAGGIPCYPVLLDDPSGKFTEFEGDYEKLYQSLKKLGVVCIELIPGRNDGKILKEFVDFFNSKGFIITFGTEHNSPEMIPLTVSTRESVPLDETMKLVAWEGACIIAAHQYLRYEGRQGYVMENGKNNGEQKKELAKLGQYVIEYYLNRKVK
ncbi:MAG TPA: hypothetical protein PL123_02530 [Bacteroidales bacterium]|nr:hypothetical protein [Bacteroidales bacterium]